MGLPCPARPAPLAHTRPTLLASPLPPPPRLGRRGQIGRVRVGVASGPVPRPDNARPWRQHKRHCRHIGDRFPVPSVPLEARQQSRSSCPRPRGANNGPVRPPDGLGMAPRAGGLLNAPRAPGAHLRPSGVNLNTLAGCRRRRQRRWATIAVARHGISRSAELSAAGRRGQKQVERELSQGTRAPEWRRRRRSVSFQ